MAGNDFCPAMKTDQTTDRTKIEDEPETAPDKGTVYKSTHVTFSSECGSGSFASRSSTFHMDPELIGNQPDRSPGPEMGLLNNEERTVSTLSCSSCWF